MKIPISVAIPFETFETILLEDINKVMFTCIKETIYSLLSFCAYVLSE